jgi:hypothetical protein
MSSIDIYKSRLDHEAAVRMAKLLGKKPPIFVNPRDEKRIKDVAARKKKFLQMHEDAKNVKKNKPKHATLDTAIVKRARTG